MVFFENVDPVTFTSELWNTTKVLSGSMREIVSLSLSSGSCADKGVTLDDCRDDNVALSLKWVAIAAILTAGVAGVALPLVGRKRRFLQTDGSVFVAAKAFAAGVILATGFVHMLPDGASALTNQCLPRVPWSKFPFAEFVAMMAALGTLLIDFVGTQFCERRQEPSRNRVEDVDSIDSSAASASSQAFLKTEEGNGGGMHIVGIHAHAAAHHHSHARGRESCEGVERAARDIGHAHTSSWGDAQGEEGISDDVRHVVVAQVLELGIVSHSVIIGLSLGVSQSPCAIRPLIAALSFHQLFEGFALGGCISQARFKMLPATLMACFFAITTPTGIAIGMAVSSFYNRRSPVALVVEGMLDSISAGILVYMALVDLIAADFLSRRMSCNFRLQIASYFTLFLGAGLMSMLAVWA